MNDEVLMMVILNKRNKREKERRERKVEGVKEESGFIELREIEGINEEEMEIKEGRKDWNLEIGVMKRKKEIDIIGKMWEKENVESEKKKGKERKEKKIKKLLRERSNEIMIGKGDLRIGDR